MAPAFDLNRHDIAVSRTFSQNPGDALDGLPGRRIIGIFQQLTVLSPLRQVQRIVAAEEDAVEVGFARAHGLA